MEHQPVHTPQIMALNQIRNSIMIVRMTKTHTIPHLLIACTLLLMSASYAHASEVTGILSSSAGEQTSTSVATGSLDSSVSGGTTLGGTVVADESGGSSSGGSRSGGSSGSSRPQGSVLGESTTRPASPSFPNAGFAPDGDGKMAFVWSGALIGSLLASLFVLRRMRA